MSDFPYQIQYGSVLPDSKAIENKFTKLILAPRVEMILIHITRLGDVSDRYSLKLLAGRMAMHAIMIAKTKEIPVYSSLITICFISSTF